MKIVKLYKGQYDICDVETFEKNYKDLVSNPEEIEVPVFSWDDIKDRLEGKCTLLGPLGSCSGTFNPEHFQHRRWVRPKDIFPTWHNYKNKENTFYDFSEYENNRFDMRDFGDRYVMIVVY